jgi:hypothetical protein
MAVTEEKDGALATAAAAAAAGAAVYGLKKALASGGNGKTSRGEHEDDDYENDGDDGDERENGGGSSAGGFLESVWESASDAMVPLAEEAADAAGKWVAQNAPDLIRERIVPRFIESFQDAA